MYHVIAVLLLSFLGSEQPTPGGDTGASTSPQSPEAVGFWRMTLSQTIRYGLENSPRLRRPGGAEDQAEAAGNRDTFEVSEKAAFVHTIEKHYWALALRHVRVWSAEIALELGTQVQRDLKAAGNELEPSAATDLQEHLKICRDRAGSAVSEQIAAERTLREFIGVPATERRRLCPISPPSDVKPHASWETCLAEMSERLPEIPALPHHEGSSEVAHAVLPERIAKSLEGGSAVTELERVRASQRRFAHARTHQLAMCFLEVEANASRFAAAKRLNDEAQVRLQSTRDSFQKAQREFRPYLDAIMKLDDAMICEARFKIAYNLSLTELEVAKGTLLERDQSVSRAAVEAPATLSVESDASRPAPRQAEALKAEDLPFQVRGESGAGRAS